MKEIAKDNGLQPVLIHVSGQVELSYERHAMDPENWVRGYLFQILMKQEEIFHL